TNERSPVHSNVRLAQKLDDSKCLGDQRDHLKMIPGALSRYLRTSSLRGSLRRIPLSNHLIFVCYSPFHTLRLVLCYFFCPVLLINSVSSSSIIKY
ncbi:unnamed protein product, partial [Mycena citricolor]